jgi:hypothetical protein
MSKRKEILHLGLLRHGALGFHNAKKARTWKAAELSFVHLPADILRRLCQMVEWAGLRQIKPFYQVLLANRLTKKFAQSELLRLGKEMRVSWDALAAPSTKMTQRVLARACTEWHMRCNDCKWANGKVTHEAHPNWIEYVMHWPSNPTETCQHIGFCYDCILARIPDLVSIHKTPHNYDIREECRELRAFLDIPWAELYTATQRTRFEQTSPPAGYVSMVLYSPSMLDKLRRLIYPLKLLRVQQELAHLEEKNADRCIEQMEDDIGSCLSKREKRNMQYELGEMQDAQAAIDSRMASLRWETSHMQQQLARLSGASGKPPPRLRFVALRPGQSPV